MVDHIRPGTSPWSPPRQAGAPVPGEPPAPAARPAQAPARDELLTTRRSLQGTGPLPALPWENPLRDAQKQAFVEGLVWAYERQSRDFLARYGARFTADGQALLERASKAGLFQEVDPHWRTLHDPLGAFLDRGGDPAIAQAILGQVHDPGLIKPRVDANAQAEQKTLAVTNPARYFEVMAALATTGQAPFWGLKLDPDRQAALRAARLSDNDRLNALFQVARSERVLAFDTIETAEEHSLPWPPERARPLAELLAGVEVAEPDELKAGAGLARNMGERLAQARAKGLPGLLVPLDGETLALVRGLDRYGAVTLVDADGQTQRLSSQAFLARLA